MHLMSLALQADTILHVAAKFHFELLLKKYKPFIKKKMCSMEILTEIHGNN